MVLFVETSWESGSLALLGEDGQLHLVDWKKRSSHSEVITQKFQDLLEAASAKITDVSKIVINVGPGSFTGIRVGISFATSLAYMFKLPLITVNTLEVMAFKSNIQGKILVALPAIKGHFYVAGYNRSGDQISEELCPKSRSHDETQALIDKYLQFINGSRLETRPSASDLSLFFRAKARNFEELLWNFVKPLYLRRSEAEEKLSRGLLKPIYIESEHQVERSTKKQGD